MVTAASREPDLGLRERKKQRTRAILIDAALELCLRQGYEQTTVDQIASMAEVSPRTYSRYFATKEAVFLTLLEDLSEQIAAEVRRLPRGIGPIEALRAAHIAVLTKSAAGQIDGFTSDRVVLTLRVINSADALQQGAFEFKSPRGAGRSGRADGRRRRRPSAVAGVVGVLCHRAGRLR